MDGEEISAIADTVGKQYLSTNQNYADGEIADPFADDTDDPVDLPASGDPIFATNELNENDAIILDGEDDTYSYNFSIAEPCTLIFAYRRDDTEEIQETVWYEDSNNFLRDQPDNDQYQLQINDDNHFGGDSILGDVILTISFSKDAVDVFINGGDANNDPQITSTNLNEEQMILDSGTFYSEGGESPFFTGATGGITVHPDVKLTGSDRTQEEQRLESEFDMDVLS